MRYHTHLVFCWNKQRQATHTDVVSALYSVLSSCSSSSSCTLADARGCEGALDQVVRQVVTEFGTADLRAKDCGAEIDRDLSLKFLRIAGHGGREVAECLDGGGTQLRFDVQYTQSKGT